VNAELFAELSQDHFVPVFRNIKTGNCIFFIENASMGVSISSRQLDGLATWVEVEASVDSEWRWTHYELQSRVFIW
jgi:hypothetical protein